MGKKSVCFTIAAALVAGSGYMIHDAATKHQNGPQDPQARQYWKAKNDFRSVMGDEEAIFSDEKVSQARSLRKELGELERNGANEEYNLFLQDVSDRFGQGTVAGLCGLISFFVPFNGKDKRESRSYY